MVNYTDPNSYKDCKKKLYDIHVCKPPKDTVVINVLEQSDITNLLNGKTFFTVDELSALKQNGDDRFDIISKAVSSGRAYLVSEKAPFVLAGTAGESWTISLEKLAQKYDFITKTGVEPINANTLSKRTKKGVIDWTPIRTQTADDVATTMACFVPVEQRGQVSTHWGTVLDFNSPNCNHGKGDFIVCSKLPSGQPNLSDCWVVNGEIFARTYNNRGWTSCLVPSTSAKNITKESLPKLFGNKSSSGDKSSSKDAAIKLFTNLAASLSSPYVKWELSPRNTTQRDIILVSKSVSGNIYHTSFRLVFRPTDNDCNSYNVLLDIIKPEGLPKHTCVFDEPTIKLGVVRNISKDKLKEAVSNIVAYKSFFDANSPAVALITTMNKYTNLDTFKLVKKTGVASEVASKYGITFETMFIISLLNIMVTSDIKDYNAFDNRILKLIALYNKLVLDFKDACSAGVVTKAKLRLFERIPQKDSENLAIDYDFIYKGVKYYGYASVIDDYFNCCFWEDDDYDKDPLELINMSLKNMLKELES